MHRGSPRAVATATRPAAQTRLALVSIPMKFNDDVTAND
jgi:hypothetical protein